MKRETGNDMQQRPLARHNLGMLYFMVDALTPPPDILFSTFFGGSSCDHERDGNPYLCPDSCAMVNARPRPVSSLMVQLLYLLHIPLIGAKPAKPARQFFHARVELFYQL